MRLIVIADRGFARASFFEYLKRERHLFVIRIRKGVMIHHKNRSTLIENIPLKKTTKRWLPNVEYRQDRKVKVNILIVKTEDAPQPWYLASNFHNVRKVQKLYERRFWIEEMFRDLKHHLSIDKVYVSKDLQRKLLLFGLFIAYLYWTFIGWQAKKLKVDRHVVISVRHSLCLLKIALELIDAGLPEVQRFLLKVQRKTPSYHLDWCKENGNPPPAWKEQAGSVYVTFWPPFLPEHQVSTKLRFYVSAVRTVH